MLRRTPALLGLGVLLLATSFLTLPAPTTAFLHPTSPRLPTKASTSTTRLPTSAVPSPANHQPQPLLSRPQASPFAPPAAARPDDALLLFAAMAIPLFLLAPSSVEALDGLSTSMLVAKEPWVTPLKIFLDPFLAISSFAFLTRIVLSWYPQVNVNKLPFNIIAWPTEPFMKVVRGFVPPAFGVDISPIIWLGFLSFLREVLVSEQGLLTILEMK